MKNVESIFGSSRARIRLLASCLIFFNFSFIFCMNATAEAFETQDSTDTLRWDQYAVHDMNSVDYFCIYYRRGWSIVGFGIHRSYGSLNLMKVEEVTSKTVHAQDYFTTTVYSTATSDSSFSKTFPGNGKVVIKSFQSGLGPEVRFGLDILLYFSWNGPSNSDSNAIALRMDEVKISGTEECKP